MKDKLYIVTASWEDRFLLGARRAISQTRCNRALCFWFEDYAERHVQSRNVFGEEFSDLTPKFERLRLLDSDGHRPLHTELWRRIFGVLSENLDNIESFVFDITTTPRVALWIILDLLTERGIPGVIYYHRAAEHGSWCGSDPDRPYVVPKLGGISNLDNTTKLLVISGFDEDRSEHFVSHYEPTETMVFLQTGSQHDEKRNRAPHIRRFYGRPGIELMDIDSYSRDWGYAELAAAAAPFSEGANLVLSSVGPKTSAVALYRLHRNLTNSAMAYCPCHDYNGDYSHGIAKTLILEWTPDKVVVPKHGVFAINEFFCDGHVSGQPIDFTRSLP